MFYSDLGSGKTCLSRGFVEDQCIDEDDVFSSVNVASPTYLIDNTYNTSHDTM